MPGMPALDAAFDDDEDTSRGDMFDHLTPREMSLSRYQQNHEWMEEILSSPYRINQITPPDLGIGLKGELASLTEGIFVAQGGDAFNNIQDQAYVGRLDPGKAEEFRKRVNEHVESTKAEIEKMKAAHAEALAAVKQQSLISTKEKELRSLVEETGPEVWRVDGRTDGNEEETTGRQPAKTSLDEVVSQVESVIGHKVEAKPTVNRIQDGGYQAPAPEPAQPAPGSQMSRQPSHAGSHNSGVMVGESDIDMGGTAAGLLDQMHTGFSSTSTPVNNFPTPQPNMSAVQSNVATPSQMNVHSPAPVPAQAAPSQPTGADVSMGGTDSTSNEQTTTAPDQGTGSGDWVVVPKNGEGPETTTIGSASGAPVNAGDEGRDTPKPSAPAKPISAAATPAVTDGGSATFDQNDFSSLGDLDTAGDALAGYDAPALDGSAGELGDGLDLQMDMEDSAFGDAFHGVEATNTPGDGQNQDL
jgi:hypothetical protein